MKEFALIGAAGFVAPRHLAAIHETGGRLVAAVDPSDSVGVLDRYFPHAEFFTDEARFSRFLQGRKKLGRPVSYVSVCSPNDLHDEHVRLGLRADASVICEKPLVLSPHQLDSLADLERESKGRVYTVLQLRFLPVVQRLRAAYFGNGSTFDKKAKPHVHLDYVTRRGPWYHVSWKGQSARSGGLAMNIGVHLFDVLLWIFGPVHHVEVKESSPTRMRGTLELLHAHVTWLLSVEERDLPPEVMANGGHALRSIRIGERSVDLSGGFSELHTRVYQQVLKGNAPGIGEARPAIELVHRIRTARGVLLENGAPGKD